MNFIKSHQYHFIKNVFSVYAYSFSITGCLPLQHFLLYLYSSELHSFHTPVDIQLQFLGHGFTTGMVSNLPGSACVYKLLANILAAGTNDDRTISSTARRLTADVLLVQDK